MNQELTGLKHVPSEWILGHIGHGCGRKTQLCHGEGTWYLAHVHVLKTEAE